MRRSNRGDITSTPQYRLSSTSWVLVTPEERIGGTRSTSLDGAVSKAPKFLSSVGLGSPRLIVFALRSPRA